MSEGAIVFLFATYILFLWALGGGLLWTLYYFRELFTYIGKHGTKKHFNVSFTMAEGKCGLFKSTDIGMVCLFWPLVVGIQAIALTVAMPFYGAFLLGRKLLISRATLVYLQKNYDLDKAQAKKLSTTKDIDSLKALNMNKDDFSKSTTRVLSSDANNLILDYYPEDK